MILSKAFKKTLENESYFISIHPKHKEEYNVYFVFQNKTSKTKLKHQIFTTPKWPKTIKTMWWTEIN